MAECIAASMSLMIQNLLEMLMGDRLLLLLSVFGINWLTSDEVLWANNSMALHRVIELELTAGCCWNSCTDISSATYHVLARPP